MVIAALLRKLVAREHLTQLEAAALLSALMSDEATDTQIAAALTALAAKGETDLELAGFAETMRDRAERVTTRHSRFVDTCGTGGSPAKTFNVSTASAFVVAAAGLPVAKHGNVGVTTKAGSADVLRALGVKVEVDAASVGRSIDEIGIGFMFAPLHHTATRRVAQVRRELGLRTIFNLLGPLTNPAAAPYQVVGVSHEAPGERVARALSRLGVKRAWVVRGSDGLDEITLTGKTSVFECRPESVIHFEVSPEDFGLSEAPISHLGGGDAEANAAIIRDVLDGSRRDAARDLVLANAAAALRIADEVSDLKEGVERARAAIDSGAASRKIKELRDFNARV
jgi:anthranilate phosphoribosyltransferase